MKVGFIGLGVMGLPMCTNIINKHDDAVYAYAPHAESRQRAADRGAIPCETLKDLAQADVIFSIVPRPTDVKSIYTELSKHLDEHHVCCDMSTIDPKTTLEVYEMLKEKGIRYADAPVIKPAWAVVSGELGILCGSSDEVFEVLKPFFEYMGKDIMHVGKNGSGVVVKLCQNCLTHSIQQAVNETVTLAGIYGVTVETFHKACNNGGAGNLYFNNKIDNLVNEDYTMSFPIDFTVKDLGLAEKMAIEVNFPMPSMQAALNNSRMALSRGMAKLDTSATILTVREGFLEKNLTDADLS